MTADSSVALLVRRLGRNVGLLTGGAAATSILGVFTLALLTRGLGPSLFGIFALVQSYVIVLGRILSFDTWQGLIRFGADAQSRDDQAMLRAICSLGVSLDLISAAMSGAIGLALLIVTIGATGLPAEYLAPTAFYVSSLFLQLPGMPIGILRFLDRFKWLAAITVAESTAKLASAAALLLFNAGLAAYLYAFGALIILFNVVRAAAAIWAFSTDIGPFRWSAAKELRRAGVPFARFSAGSWLTGTLNVSRRDGSTLIVAALLGPVAAGYFSVAQRLVRPANDAAEIVRQAIFPEISRLVADNRHSAVRTLVRRVLTFTIPVALMFFLAIAGLGELLLNIIAGANYEGAYWVLVALAAAASMYLCIPPLSSLVILYAGMRRYAIATALASAVWALVVTVPMCLLGIDGAGIGELVFLTLWLLLNLTVLRRATRRLPPSR